MTVTFVSLVCFIIPAVLSLFWSISVHRLLDYCDQISHLTILVNVSMRYFIQPIGVKRLTTEHPKNCN